MTKRKKPTEIPHIPPDEEDKPKPIKPIQTGRQFKIPVKCVMCGKENVFYSVHDTSVKESEVKWICHDCGTVGIDQNS